MEVDTESSAPHRVQELWFEDGNLVIQAENSQYRVFRSILARASPIFHDMLSFPQPPESELVDGCPFVRLPDRDSEVAPFLRAIFDSEFFAPYPALTDFDTIVGCLKLGHKYSVDYIFRRALVHLSSGYHTKLADSDANFDDNSPIFMKASWPHPSPVTYRIFIIQLAREVDASWILPTAFYNLSVSFDTLGMDVFHGATYNDIPVAISRDDQKSLLQGHSIQVASCLKDIPLFFVQPRVVDGCLHVVNCIRKRLEALGNFMSSVEAGIACPLDVWEEKDWDSINLCPSCLKKLKQTHQEARQAFWDKLPEIYGLPPWEELEKMKAAALGTESLL
ncbi:hypothetical protein B0H19DRAFT_939766 [Mycena capillaripes]|nr:hypothetical protein B0H19DRAFT_939766 [Mycena capillaripes]